MAKIYDKYLELKSNNDENIYLFKCGNFYIALDSDAIILNDYFDLKLTKFSNLCDKCGFPINSLDKYKGLIDKNNLKYKIIEDINNDKIVKQIKEIIHNQDLENLDYENMKDIIKKINLLFNE